MLDAADPRGIQALYIRCPEYSGVNRVYRVYKHSGAAGEVIHPKGLLYQMGHVMTAPYVVSPSVLVPEKGMMCSMTHRPWMTSHPYT